MDRNLLVIERLQQVLNEQNIKKSALARVAGVTPQAINNWFNNGKISVDSAKLISDQFGYPIDWLLGGTSAKIESNVGEKGGFDLWNSQTPLSDDDYEVPFYKDITLAAGTGSFEQADYNGFKLRFSKATLRRQGVEYHNAVCVTATGNSMEPVIPDGTTIGVDLGNKSIRDGKIYAINHGGLLRVKILSRLPNDLVVIRSYNAEEYPDETVHLSEVQLISKVFWWSVLV